MWRGFIFGAMLALAGPSAAVAAGDCAANRIGIETPTARHAFTVEVADTEASRGQGLMNRAEMASGAGMLFVYPSPRRAQFWMANTLIALDMIFAGPDGVVLGLHENAVPLDRTVIDGGDGVQFVLEINGGLARRLGIAAGARLHHPAIAGSDCAASLQAGVIPSPKPVPRD